MVFDNPDSTAVVVEPDVHRLTADDTLACVEAIFPDPDDSWKMALFAGRPLAIPQPEHDLIIFVSLSDAGFEVWLHRRVANGESSAGS